MYEYFSNLARKTMQLANQEAQRFNHEYIGPEHLLLGMVKEGSGTGAKILMDHGINLRILRLKIENRIQSGPAMITMGKLPQTPHMKKIIQHAINEKQTRYSDHVGTEHLLLGLLRLKSEDQLVSIVAIDAIEECGVDLNGLMKVVNDYFDSIEAAPLKLNGRAQQILARAGQVAIRMGDSVLDTHHLLLSVIEIGNSDAAFCLSNSGLDRLKIFQAVHEFSRNSSQQNEAIRSIGDRVPKSEDLGKCLASAEMAARMLKHKFINGEHLFLGLLEAPENESFLSTKVLNSLNLNLEAIRKDMIHYAENGRPLEKDDINISAKENAKLSKTAGNKNSAVNKFTVDRTQSARFQYHPPIELDPEVIEKILLALLRRNKNNILLIGDPRLSDLYLNSIAHLLVSYRVPEPIFEHSLCEVKNFTLSEEKFAGGLMDVLNEIRRDGRIILAFEDLTRLLDYPAPYNPNQTMLDATAQWLDFPSVRVIGVVDPSDFGRHEEVLKSMNSFEIIDLAKSKLPPVEQLIKRSVNRLEDFHLCYFPPETIRLAIKLCEHYSTSAPIEDQVVLLLDQAAAEKLKVVSINSGSCESAEKTESKSETDDKETARKKLDGVLKTLEQQMRCCREEGDHIRLAEINTTFDKVLMDRVNLKPLDEVDSEAVISTMAKTLGVDNESVKNQIS